MKSKLLAFVILFAPLVALAADPVVVVTSFSSVTVNGTPAGTVVDVLANVTAPNIRARLFDALLAYEANLVAAANASVTTANAAKVAAESSKAAETARVAAIVTKLKGVSPLLLPVEVRAELLTAKEKERADLLAAKADAEAKLAALPTP